ncbi:MAG: amino acid ABC transporter substrate-binding protein [Deltaproteobacteria bacterium]|nr:amino acid ABC transporter substrate-binding protein [Deltaproteobacteria bacterium]
MKKIIILLLLLYIPANIFAKDITLMLSEFPPYIEGNKGLAIDILNEIFKGADYTVKTEKVPLSRAIYRIKRKINTCAPIQRSQERETLFKWVGPILITQTALFSRSDDPIKIDVLKDAFNYKIMVARGSADADYLKGFGAKIEIANNDDYNSKKLKRKRLRLWAADIIIASYYAKKNDLKIKKQLSISTTLVPLAFNINTPDSIINHLNEQLNKMYKDGTIKKFYDKYRKRLNIEEAFYFL